MWPKADSCIDLGPQHRRHVIGWPPPAPRLRALFVTHAMAAPQFRLPPSFDGTAYFQLWVQHSKEGSPSDWDFGRQGDRQCIGHKQRGRSLVWFMSRTTKAWAQKSKEKPEEDSKGLDTRIQEKLERDSKDLDTRIQEIQKRDIKGLDIEGPGDTRRYQRIFCGRTMRPYHKKLEKILDKCKEAVEKNPKSRKGTRRVVSDYPSCAATPTKVNRAYVKSRREEETAGGSQMESDEIGDGDQGSNERDNETEPDIVALRIVSLTIIRNQASAQHVISGKPLTRVSEPPGIPYNQCLAEYIPMLRAEDGLRNKGLSVDETLPDLVNAIQSTIKLPSPCRNILHKIWKKVEACKEGELNNLLKMPVSQVYNVKAKKPLKALKKKVTDARRRSSRKEKLRQLCEEPCIPPNRASHQHLKLKAPGQSRSSLDKWEAALQDRKRLEGEVKQKELDAKDLLVKQSALGTDCGKTEKKSDQDEKRMRKKQRVLEERESKVKEMGSQSIQVSHAGSKGAPESIQVSHAGSKGAPESIQVSHAGSKGAPESIQVSHAGSKGQSQVLPDSPHVIPGCSQLLPYFPHVRASTYHMRRAAWLRALSEDDPDKYLSILRQVRKETRRWQKLYEDREKQQREEKRKGRGKDECPG
ncbi:hypothetical protein Bbelb_350180 [Branchiostoma belcheri]|nr:hypothetical protein Bbelb_350180 [Branchiostoma belcheri]